MRRVLTVAVERFALAQPFAIARGIKTESVVVMATVMQDGVRGRGECVPYGRYGESLESVVAQIESIRPQLEAGASRGVLQGLLPAGAARNAVDCALWDLEAKRLEVPVASLAGLHRLAPATTAFTLSLDSPDRMAAAAAAASHRPVLKIKLGCDGDVARIAAVRAAAPEATLIVDANEGWTSDTLAENLAACEKAGVALVEQPLPAGQDALLATIRTTVPLCADESVHTREGLAALRDRYGLINVKLDKTGGLTEALAVCTEAEALGFGLFVGCMVGTSLAMAPAMLLAARARFVDLDGPLLLAQDRDPGLHYDGSIIHPPTADLWG
ncbi:enolase C-terminal domain-like protein [Lichenihabitans sp. Uapishka_5]|uniref:N-acetyl-D-Glu racemase DgcA n=1 Tax=Lichenihabitans sp. Uapishka_5 TaxID=3037302 RepID=UPI0029E81A0D|nr:N-acetyl-D-Glu racemase DgcA [Lichenihabitans sp. Uapishka_5]MDX7949692.1 enolase C-terminal domain-like protein [Lichenihabitans sp. Uapishka_5]